MWNLMAVDGYKVQKLYNFWWHLKSELNFKTLLYYQVESCNCWSDRIVGNSNSSALVWQYETFPPYLKPGQDRDILAVSCFRAESYQVVLKSLSVMLNHMRDIPIMLEMCEEGEQLVAGNFTWRILQRCQELYMLNVLVLPADFPDTGKLFAYQAFPHFRVLTLLYHASLTLFPFKLDNLQGFGIRTLPDLSEPHTILTRSANGEYVISGLMWRVLVEFARLLNGSILMPVHPYEVGRYAKIMQYMHEGALDIAATVRPINQVPIKTIHDYSYPLFVGSWCTMLPAERLLSSYEATTLLLQSPWTYLYLLLIYVVHRWLSRRRILRTRLFRLLSPLVQLVLLNALVAQLSALYINPLRLNYIRNYDQLDKAGIRIMGMRIESYSYPMEMRITHAASLLLHDYPPNMLLYRNALNTSFGYTITSIKWRMYAEQQKYFKRPLFRYSKDLCVQKFTLFSLAIQENCWYRSQLQVFLMRLRENGLLRLWNHYSFYDMLQANRSYIGDPSTQIKARPIHWSEWRYIMMIYAIVQTAGLLAFVIELSYYYANVYLDSL